MTERTELVEEKQEYIYIYIYIYVCSTLFLIGSDSLFQRNIDQLTLLVQRFLKFLMFLT